MSSKKEYSDQNQLQNSKEKSSIDNPSSKVKPMAYAGPEQIVYEGSKITLEGSCNLDSKNNPNRNISFTWELDSSHTDNDVYAELDNPNIRNPSFIAPYVKFDFKGQNNKPYATLIFKLVVTDKRTGLSSDPSMVTIIAKMIQRALILQGGGALGAYELGVYRALCERLIEKDKSDGARKNRPIFDIIAGASIGALNAALIVHSIKKGMNETVQTKGKVKDTDIPAVWERSVKELTDFWCDITKPFPWFSSNLFKKPWDWANQISKTWLEY